VRGAGAMAEGTITTDELGHRLVRAGHFACEDGETACGTDVCPTPDTIVTVGMNLDPTLRPACRHRYYACYLKSEDEPVPALRDDPSFTLPVPFLAASLESSADDCFLGGPCRWLLQRIARFDSVLLWPACRGSDTAEAFAQSGLLEEVPSLRGKLPADLPSLSGIGAVVLDLLREPDCRVLWDVMSRVSQSFFDFFVADPECREVYRLHHHGKVVVSILEESLRQELLDEIDGHSDLIEDCSGYTSDWDDEDDLD
jgi:hypothetical protein